MKKCTGKLARVPTPRGPSAIGIGAAKSGTTWLWAMLRQHPRVFLPAEKELHYFNDLAFGGAAIANPRARKPLEWYLDFFADARPEQVCGEISPTYLWNESAPGRVAAFDPEMKIFALLREPVGRLFSAYLFGRQKGEIGSATFEEALERHPYLVDRTRYFTHLSRWFDTFPAANVKVLFHDDIGVDPGAVLVDVERFIGVPDLVPDGVEESRNVTGAPAHPGLNRTLMSARLALKRRGLERVVDAGRSIGLDRPFRYVQRQTRPYAQRPTLRPDTEARLHELFRPEVEGLERLLGVELPRWKAPA